MRKKIYALMAFFLAFVGNVMAWEPVITETHWFGVYEYQDYNGPFTTKEINFSNGFIESIVIAKSWAGPNVTQHPKTSFYSWIDHKLRFSVTNPNTTTWDLERNGNSKYNGYGLKNISGNDQTFRIHNLNSGDSYTVNYYVANGSDVTAVNGSGTGTVEITIPAGAVIRSVVINVANYQKAESGVRALEPNELQKYLGNAYNSSSFGYRYYYTKSGVLEDKRGAVPYITMKFGADNDMTFVRAIADVSYTYGALQQVDAAEMKYYTKENGGSPVLASTSDEYIVHSAAGASNDWDAQFFITAPYALPIGQTVQIEFWAKADHNATIGSQQHEAAGNYIHWGCIGDKEITTEYQHFTGEFTTNNSNNANPDWLWQTIAFNLNNDKSQNNTFYFKDIKISIPERTENVNEDSFGAASIIDASNNLDPATDNYDYLQYRWTYKDNNYSNPYTEAEIRDRLVGKEWSTFTAKKDPTHTVDPSLNGTDYNGVNYVYGDNFLTIFPLCGNFFYFFPEVDGKLVVEYYCEGTDETPAFWFKTNADGEQMTGGDQGGVHCKQFLANGQDMPNGRTNGTNNYYLTADVKSGCVYYLCSLPTNMSHERPILRVKSYAFIPSFRVDPLYKVIDNVTAKNNNSNELKYAAEIFGGPYNGTADPSDNLNTNDLNSYFRNGEDPAPGQYYRNKEAEPRVKCLGNVASAKVKVFEENGRQFLGFYDIQFKQGVNPETGDTYNPGGAVVAHINNKGGQASFVLTIAYDAAEAKMEDGVRVAETRSTGTEVKRWDFFTDGNWDLGKYGTDDGTRYATNESGWKAKSKLFKEVHKADGETQDWSQTYVTLQEGGTGIEPIFKSVYDMEGDNADMIHETAGLVFHTHANHVGIWNENGASSKTSFQDRFVGLMEDGQLVIPLLKAGDRIVMKMGCYGNADSNVDTQSTTLKITGAQDAIGRDITTDYKIGGSGVNIGNSLADSESEFEFDDKSKPYGEYHFIAKGGDVTFEIEEGDLLKIYSIEIYRHDGTILSENQVAAESNKPYILNVPENSTKDHAYLHVNHRGEGEPSTYHLETRKTGTITQDDVEPDSDNDEKDGWFNYTVNRATNPANAKFGIFEARLGVLTLESGLYNSDPHAYVTDYADRMIPVGYRQTMDYPYTWDLTDLKDYTGAGIDASTGNEVDVEENDYDNSPDLKIWKDYNMRVAPETYEGYLFAPGSQLYGGTTMFDETRGLGIIHYGKNEVMNITDAGNGDDNGLKVTDAETADFFEFVVPQVPEKAAVYVHAVKSGDGPKKIQVRANKNADPGSFTFEGKQTVNTGTDEEPVYNEQGDNVVFAIKNTTDAPKNMHICVQGYVVNKIAVATDEKKVNVKGYASESRNHDIDAKLLPYFTGEDFRTYLVSDPDYTNLKLTLTDIASTDEFVMPANTGCVIRRTGDAADLQFNPFKDGKGFHLFVPDMHDTEKVVAAADKETNDEFMVPVAKEMQIPYTNNYVKLDYKNFNVDNAVWYAWTWNEGEEGTWIAESNGGRFFGLKEKVIFARMDPAFKNNPSWDGCWNQTENLTAQNGKTYTITGWGLNGEWSGDAATGDMTNYVLTYRYKKLNGSTLSDAMFEGEEKFYRVYSGWDIWLRANSAYLQLPTSSVLPDNAARSARMFSFRVVNNVMPGDVNYDETVNVADFISVGSSILGKSPAVFYTKGADVNNDTNINVSDFIGIANIILSTPEENAAPAQAPRRASMNGNGLETSDYAVEVRPLTATEPGSQQVLSIRMKNTQPLVGYEFTILLPDGVTIATDDEVAAAQLSNARTTAQRTNFFAAQQLGNNALKVLCGTTNGDSDGLYSFTGTDGEVARITVNIAEGFNPDNYEVAVIDGLCTNRECMSMPLVPMSFNVTGISDVMAEGEAVEGSSYYNVQGQRLGNRPAQRGVYIVNGKKVTVK